MRWHGWRESISRLMCACEQIDMQQWDNCAICADSNVERLSAHGVLMKKAGMQRGFTVNGLLVLMVVILIRDFSRF